MNSFINVTSEIGLLKKVLLHRPGREVENLIPEYLGRLLFDDIPYLKIAQEEHDKFAKLLTDNGAEVYYLESLTAEALMKQNIKEKFVKEFLLCSGLSSAKICDSLTEYLIGFDTETMVSMIMSGVRKNEVEIKGVKSLSEHMMSDYPFYLDPMPNLYFTRDPGASIGKGLTINKMSTVARSRESLFLKYIYENHPIFEASNTPLWYDRINENSIEGGDELVLSSKVLAIGCSERTSPQAIEIVAKNLFAANTTFEKILVFDIPKCRAFMHLDTVFTMVDYDMFTMHPAIYGPLNVYEITRGKENEINIKYRTEKIEEILKDALHTSSIELIKCGGGDLITAGREQWNDGSNTLAIAPGVVVTYERNYVTNEILDKKGIKVHTIASSELSRGRGGPRCMSMPLQRDSID